MIDAMVESTSERDVVSGLFCDILGDWDGAGFYLRASDSGKGGLNPTVSQLASNISLIRPEMAFFFVLTKFSKKKKKPGKGVSQLAPFLWKT